MPKHFQVGDTTYQFPDEMSDDEAQGILDKQGILKRQSTEPTITAPPKSWSEKTNAPPVLKQLMDFIQGANSSVNNLVYRGANLIRPSGSPDIFTVNPSLKEATAAPQTFAGQTGRQLIDTVPYVAGAVATGGATAGLPVLSRMLAQGGTAALTSAAQSGGDPAQMGVAGTLAGAGEAIPPVVKGIGNLIHAKANAKVAEEEARKLAERTGQSVYTSLRDMVSSEAGMTPTKALDPTRTSQYLRLKAQGVLDTTYKSASDAANGAIMEAVKPANTQLIFQKPPQPVQKGASSLAEILGIDASAAERVAAPPKPVAIAGPIVTNRFGQLLDGILTNADRQFIKGIPGITPDNPKLIQIATKYNELTQGFQALDPTGNLKDIPNAPIPFKEAWEMAKNLGDLGYNPRGAETNLTINQARQMRDLWSSLTDDMRTSMSKVWGDGESALALFNKSKQAVNLRHSYFNQETGLNQFINDTKSPVATLDAILKDPNKVQKILTMGEAVIDGVKLKGRDPRGTLAAYDMSNVLANSFRQNPLTANVGAGAITNPGPGTFNLTSFMDHFTDPSLMRTNELLYGKEKLANIQEFGHNLAEAMSKGTPMTIEYNPDRRAVMITKALATPLLGSYHVAGAAVELSAYALSKLMNGNSGRVMANLAGNKPLQMPMENAVRIIGGALNGTRATIYDEQNRPKPGMFIGGKFVPDSE